MIAHHQSVDLELTTLTDELQVAVFRRDRDGVVATEIWDFRHASWRADSNGGWL